MGRQNSTEHNAAKHNAIHYGLYVAIPNRTGKPLQNKKTRKRSY